MVRAECNIGEPKKDSESGNGLKVEILVTANGLSMG